MRHSFTPDKAYTKSHTFKTVLETLNANHIRIRPHCPWQNGKVKRFNRTLQIEWAYRQVYSNNNERTQALQPMAQLLQPHTATRLTRTPTTDQSTVTNLMAEYI